MYEVDAEGTVYTDKRARMSAIVKETYERILRRIPYSVQPTFIGVISNISKIVSKREVASVVVFPCI